MSFAFPAHYPWLISIGASVRKGPASHYIHFLLSPFYPSNLSRLQYIRGIQCRESAYNLVVSNGVIAGPAGLV